LQALDEKLFPWFRLEVIDAVAEGYGLPKFALRSLLGGQRQLDRPYAPKKADGRGWPIVLFTSGIWGCCEMYTQFCREIASTGAIVVALEHEDGSGIFATDGATGEPVPYVPVPESANPAEFRQAFLERHVEDIGESAAAITAIASPNVGSHSHAETEAISMVLRCGDPDRIIIMGHSFGSTGVVRYFRRLTERAEPSPFCGALLMDTWTDPLSEADVTIRLPVPFAVLLSGKWKISSRCSRLVETGGKQCLAVGRVMDTGHQWVSDSHLFGPAVLLRTLGIMGRADYRRAYLATVHFARGAMQHFLRLAGPLQNFDALDQGILQLWPPPLQSAL